MIESASNVVAFKRRASSIETRHPKTLIERVYAAGSLAISADDIPIKTAALMLQALGLLLIDEILADGTPRQLARGKGREALTRPWRLSKPAFSGKAGEPDAAGAFALPS